MTKTSEPELCPECRGASGRDCRVCDGVGFKPYTPPKVKLTGGRLFHPGLVPAVAPPLLPKK